MAKSRDALIEATFRASRNYSLWAELRHAFRQYTEAQVEEAMRAPTSEVVRAHGRAEALLTVRDIFEDIDNLMKKLHP